MPPPGGSGSRWERSRSYVVVALIVLCEEARAICHPWMLVSNKHGVFQNPPIESALEEGAPPLSDVAFKGSRMVYQNENVSKENLSKKNLSET